MKLETTLDHALYYVHELNFSVIPLKPFDKYPLFQWQTYRERKPTDAELINWFKDTENNIGIVTGKISNIVAVDFDSVESLEIAEQHSFPDTSIVKTKNGFHYYYRYVDGVGNKHKFRGHKIDLRGEGGQVVAPPSIHPSGKKYEWIRIVELAELPYVLREEFLQQGKLF